MTLHAICMCFFIEVAVIQAEAAEYSTAVVLQHAYADLDIDRFTVTDISARYMLMRWLRCTSMLIWSFHVVHLLHSLCVRTMHI